MKLLVSALALIGLVLVVKFWYVALPLVGLGVFIGWKIRRKFYV